MFPAGKSMSRAGQSIYVIFIVLILMATSSIPALSDPGIRDTLRVGSVEVPENRVASVPIYFINDEPLSSVLIVLSFDETALTPDSFTLAGGRLDYMPDDSAIYRDSANLVELWVYDLEGIASGAGLLCSLFFMAGPQSGGETYTIDSASWPLPPPGRIQCAFSDMNFVTILPEIVPGSVTVQESYMCGDADGNKAINLSDILFLISFLYLDPPGPAPEPIEAGNADGTGDINLSDILYLISYLYLDPPGPGPICPD